MQAHKLDSKVTLYTRNGLDWTNRIGAVAKELQALVAQSAIIDCEAVALNERGMADFGALQKELKRGAKARITLMALDLLHLNGQDLRKQPLTRRKEQLKALLGQRSKQSLLQFNEHMEGDGTEIFKNACKLGLEGIVSKRFDLAYQSGRSATWLKAKCVVADPFVVIGYTDLKGKPGAVGSWRWAFTTARNWFTRVGSAQGSQNPRQKTSGSLHNRFQRPRRNYQENSPRTNCQASTGLDRNWWPKSSIAVGLLMGFFDIPCSSRFARTSEPRKLIDHGPWISPLSVKSEIQLEADP